jgi:hypothetical protein
MTLTVTNIDSTSWELVGLLLGFTWQKLCPEGRANDVCHHCDTTAAALSWSKHAHLFGVWGYTHFYVEMYNSYLQKLAVDVTLSRNRKNGFIANTNWQYGVVKNVNNSKLCPILALEPLANYSQNICHQVCLTNLLPKK